MKRLWLPGLVVAALAWMLTHASDPMQSNAPPPPPPKPDPPGESFSGLWVRRGEFAVLRLRQSGNYLSGEYLPKGNLRGRSIVGSGRVRGNTAQFACEVSGKRWKYKAVRTGESIDVSCWPDADALVDRYDDALKESKSLQELATRQARNQALLKQIRATHLGTFERVKDPGGDAD
ncbi:MAG: hypothetical protein U0746_02795 [Gemmataceae bacterium]